MILPLAFQALQRQRRAIDHKKSPAQRPGFFLLEAFDQNLKFTPVRMALTLAPAESTAVRL
jgi:hypothetical protein